MGERKQAAKEQEEAESRALRVGTLDPGRRLRTKLKSFGATCALDDAVVHKKKRQWLEGRATARVSSLLTGPGHRDALIVT